MANKQTYAVLLRGINVGGRHKLPMAELKTLAESVGGHRPATYIQSGNMVLDLEPQIVDTFAAALEEAIEGRFGFSVPVVLRRQSQWRQIVDNNPFLGPETDIKTLAVAFLKEMPEAEQVAALDPQRSPPDRFQVHGDTVYLEYPNGLARSKLTNAYLDSKLKTVSTVRNWRTTMKMLEMMAGR